MNRRFQSRKRGIPENTSNSKKRTNQRDQSTFELDNSKIKKLMEMKNEIEIEKQVITEKMKVIEVAVKNRSTELTDPGKILEIKKRNFFENINYSKKKQKESGIKLQYSREKQPSAQLILNSCKIKHEKQFEEERKSVLNKLVE